MAEDSSTPLHDALARIDSELKMVVEALSVLGLKRCSWCGRFLRSSDSGTLFDGGGEPVCVACVEQWWLRKRREMCVSDREVLERKLVNWLVSRHNARLVPSPGQAAAAAPPIVVGCAGCDGAGAVAGRKCSMCNGRGTLWLILSQPNGGSGAKRPPAEVPSK